MKDEVGWKMKKKQIERREERGERRGEERGEERHGGNGAHVYEVLAIRSTLGR